MFFQGEITPLKKGRFITSVTFFRPFIGIITPFRTASRAHLVESNLKKQKIEVKMHNAGNLHSGPFFGFEHISGHI